MKPQTIVITVTDGLEDTSKGAAFDYLLNELEAHGIEAVLTEVDVPHSVAMTSGDLLEALEYALDCIERGDTSDLQPVRAAIAKATGVNHE